MLFLNLKVTTIAIDNYIKERSKDFILKIKQIRLRAITLQGAIEKSLILRKQYWKMNNYIELQIFPNLEASIILDFSLLLPVKVLLLKGLIG